MLKTYLYRLKNTGQYGFEGIIAGLLQQLSSLDFYLARNGSQHGRDGRAVRPVGGSVMFECKNYLNSTPLNDRELIAELVLAVADVADLDLWILATTRNMPDQLLKELKERADKEHFEILPLDCRDDGSGPLDCLCANFPDTVIAALDKAGLSPQKQSDARSLMASIAARPGFERRIDQLRQRVDQPALGWPLWRKHTQQSWLGAVQGEAASRARFGQPLHVLDANTRLIVRSQAMAALDAWWQAWPEKPCPFAMLGEEGDGKTWAVAQWLAEKLKLAPQDFPPVLLLGECTT